MRPRFVRLFDFKEHSNDLCHESTIIETPSQRTNIFAEREYAERTARSTIQPKSRERLSTEGKRALCGNMPSGPLNRRESTKPPSCFCAISSSCVESSCPPSPLSSTLGKTQVQMLNNHYAQDNDNLYHSRLLVPSKQSQQPSNPPPTEKTSSPTTPQRWSLGKVSILILACLSLTDLVFCLVDAQVESLQALDLYDALSADVIRPAFRYHRNEQHKRNRPSMGLGSAAISTVTTALSPILPFAGGIDLQLRKDDCLKSDWWESISLVVQKVQDAFDKTSEMTTITTMANDEGMKAVLDIPRGGATTTLVKRPTNGCVVRKNKTMSRHRTYVLSSIEPFAPLKGIADLTLRDVALTFQFAIKSTQRDFNSEKFLSGLLPRVRKVVEQMSSAVTTARGGVAAPITGEHTDDQSVAVFGDIDALSFCAAMRIFAEWRVLRQVPPGYKGYAVGMALGQKDIMQNIAKIEQGVHSFVDHRIAAADDVQVASPTLRDLLQYEVDQCIQDVSKLPRLQEKSAGMGLLWVRRQLQYQTAIFANVMDVPGRFDSAQDAVQSAYSEIYSSIHGAIVRNIFVYSLRQAAPAKEIYKHMDPHRLAEVEKEAQQRFQSTGLKAQQLSFRKQSKENSLERFGEQFGLLWDKLATNLVHEWDKLADRVGITLAGQPPSVFTERTATVPPSSTTASTDFARIGCSKRSCSEEHGEYDGTAEVEKYINQELEANAYQQIRSYLHTVTPILNDLEKLFNEYNMNDPTKV